jgi:nucleoporin NDC1
MFSEIYIWSASKDADLNRIKLIPRTDRITLNEKPIYLTSFLFFLALAQTGFHLYEDYDRIDMPVVKTKPKNSTEPAAKIIHPAVQLRARIPELAQKSIKRSVTVATMAPFLYSIPLGIYPYSVRQCAWSFTRSWAKIFWSLPKSSSLPTNRPFHWSVLLATVVAGFLVTMLWEVGNAAFSIYVAQEPLKGDRPITFESRDPNGSLLTGLKGKKLQTRVSCYIYSKIIQLIKIIGLCFLGIGLHCRAIRRTTQNHLRRY